MLAFHLLLEIGQQILEDLEALVRVGRIAALETMLKHGVVEFEKAFYAEFICTGLTYIVVCGLLVDADNLGCFAVGEPSFLRSSNCLIWLISLVFPAMAVYCMLDSMLIQYT